MEKKEIDLLDIWRIALKRKYVIIACAVVILIIAGLHSFTQTPLYRATATIMIEDPGSNMLNINEAFGSGAYYRRDFLGIHFNTQLMLLTSRSLAERVANRMNLADRPELQSGSGSGFNILGKIRHFISFRWLVPRRKPPELEEDGEMEYQMDPNTMYAFTVLGGLSTFPLEETRLVYVSYSSPYPVLASDIVNTVVKEFIDYSIEMRYEATQQASEFLSDQIVTLRSELSAKEREIQRYGEEKKLSFLNDQESTVVAKFGTMTTAYNSAQIERVNAEAEYRELSGLRVDSLPQYINNTVIQGLKSQYTQTLNEYEQKSKRLKPAFPEMIAIRAKLDSIRTQLENEIGKELDAARSNYRAA